MDNKKILTNYRSLMIIRFEQLTKVLSCLIVFGLPCFANVKVNTPHFSLMINGIQRQLSYEIYQALEQTTRYYNEESIPVFEQVSPKHHVLFCTADSREVYRITSTYADNKGVKFFYCNLLELKHKKNAVHRLQKIFDSARTFSTENKKRVIIYLEHFDEIFCSGSIFYGESISLKHELAKLIMQNQENENIVLISSIKDLALVPHFYTKDEWRAITFPLPHKKMRQDLLKQFINHFGITISDKSVNMLVDRSKGLTATEVESFFLTAILKGIGLGWDFSDEHFEREIGHCLKENKKRDWLDLFLIGGLTICIPIQTYELIKRLQQYIGKKRQSSSNNSTNQSSCTYA